MKRIFNVLILIVVFTINGYSQKEIGDYLNMGLDNAEVMSKAYLKPYGEMLGVNLNSGWYTAASVHKVGGFDLTFTGVYVMAPSSSETYDISKLNTTDLTVTSASSVAPTMTGKMSSGDLPEVSFGGASPIKVPNGAGTNGMFIQMIQASVGLPFHTEISARYVPNVSFGKVGNLGLWGVGMKHSVKEYIPGVKHVPFLNMSVLGGYTRFNGSLSVAQNSMLEDGKLEIISNAYTIRYLVGVNFPVVALYAGAGYGNATSTFDVSGNYNSEGNDDLFSLKYKSGGVDLNAGVRFRIGIIGIHADYSVGDYSAITAGIGINFR